MHPLQPDFTNLTDQEIDERINDLSRKYFQAVQLYPQAAHQITMILDGAKWEKQRRSIEKEKNKADGDQDINDLIKIDRH